MTRRTQRTATMAVTSPTVTIGAAVTALVIALSGLALSPAASASIAHATKPTVSPALTFQQCQTEAKRRRTSCTSGAKIAGARCTSGQSGVLALTQTGSLIACKRSWGSVYVWMWA